MYTTLYMYMYMCMHMYEEREGGGERTGEQTPKV